jgi:hypothetical protein
VAFDGLQSTIEQRADGLQSALQLKQGSNLFAGSHDRSAAESLKESGELRISPPQQIPAFVDV